MSGLHYDQGPPLAAPLRLFLLASWALIGIGGGLLGGLEISTADRWSPQVLALTHVLTLGFLAPVMLGALLQMLPVLVGAPVPGANFIAWLALPGFGLGVPLLSAGLWRGEPDGLTLAMLPLALAWLPFLGASAVSLWRAQGYLWVLMPLRGAWLAAVVTVGLGVLLVLALMGEWAGWLAGIEFVQIIDVHVAWGLAGWVLLLVVGVSFHIVPMLQLTPAYPERLFRGVLWLIMAGLVLASCFNPGLAQGLLSLAGIAFAGLTLRLQQRRRRRVFDASLRFWRVGLLSLLLAAGLGLILPVLPEAWQARAGLLAGGLFLLGFAGSVVIGMLYKIVPFLIWLHLQTQTGASARNLPNMKTVIPESAAQRHLALHGAALLCLSLAFMAGSAGPGLTRLGGAFLLLGGALLGRNLWQARRLFLTYGGKLEVTGRRSA